jgi:hypothetical protein
MSKEVQRFPVEKDSNMLMADTITWFLVIVGLLIVFPGLWLLCTGLWPDKVTNCTDLCKQGLLKSFFVGLGITAVTAALVIGLSKAPPIGVPAAIGVVCLYLVYSNIGVAGLATVIGSRLPSPGDIERPWKATIRGGIVLELSCLLPILGWFVIMPIATMIGCGSTTRTLLKKNPKQTNALGDQPTVTLPSFDQSPEPSA